MTSWAMDALPLWEHESWLGVLVSVKTISGYVRGGKDRPLLLMFVPLPSGYDTDHQKIIPFK
jgi:hypothetical protein